MSKGVNMWVAVRRIFVVGSLTALFWLEPGCQPDEMAPYYHATEIRRDAKILLTTRPTQSDSYFATSDGR